MQATFYTVDDDMNDIEIGTVDWDGTKATPSSPQGFLADVAKSVQNWSDPAGAMRELPKLYKSAYLRAAVKDDAAPQQFSESDWVECLLEPGSPDDFAEAVRLAFVETGDMKTALEIAEEARMIFSEESAILAAPTADDPDDEEYRLDLIAEIAAALHDGDEHLDFAEQWDEQKHPRGKGGKFVVKYSAEAYSAAKERVAGILKGGKGPDAHAELLKNLGLLSVKQLHALKKEYGLSASGPDKMALAGKIAERLRKGRDEAPKEEGPSYAEWAKAEREKNKKKAAEPVDEPQEAPSVPLPVETAPAEVPFTGIDANGHRWENGVQVAINPSTSVDILAATADNTSGETTSVPEDKTMDDHYKAFESRTQAKMAALAAEGADNKRLTDYWREVRRRPADFWTAESVEKINARVDEIAGEIRKAHQDAAAAAAKKSVAAAKKSAKIDEQIAAIDAAVGIKAKMGESTSGKPLLVLRGDTKPHRELIKKHGGDFWEKDRDGREDPRWTIAGPRKIAAFIKDILSDDAKAKADAQRASDREYAAKKASEKATRVNLNVPFSKKEIAKRLGAKWDADRRTWYAPTQAIAEAVNNALGTAKAAAPQAAELPRVAPEPLNPNVMYSSVPTREAAESFATATKADPDRLKNLVASFGRDIKADAKAESRQRSLGHGKRHQVEGGMPKVGDVLQGKSGPAMVVGVGKPEFISSDWIEDVDGWSQYPDGAGWYGHYESVPIERTPEELATFEAAEKAKREAAHHTEVIGQAFQWRDPNPQLERPEKVTSDDLTGEKFPGKSYSDDEYIIGPQKIWKLMYNGRDGDNWSASNAGSSVAVSVPYSDELAAAIRSTRSGAKS